LFLEEKLENGKNKNKDPHMGIFIFITSCYNNHMSHTTHYKLSLFGALISSIAFTALSVFAIAPGATLDPVVDYPGICGGGPTDPACVINPYEGLGLGSILFLDTVGDLNTSPDLFWDNVNGRMGIGTITPAQKLEVADIARFTIPTHPDSYTEIHGGRNIRIYRSSAETVGDPGLFIYSDQDPAAFMVWDDELLRGLELGVQAGSPGIKKISLNSGTTIGSNYVSNEPPVDGLLIQGSVGIGTMNPSSLFTVGSGGLFQVNSSGDMIKIKNIDYSWPSTQGNPGSVLSNDGNGNLTWAAAGGGDSLWTLDSNLNLFSDGAGNGTMTGFGNIFSGTNAGSTNTEGVFNIFLGSSAGSSNTEGEGNIFTGFNAGHSNIGGSYNIFSGYQAGYSNIEGSSNIFFGQSAGIKNTIGNYNVVIGDSADVQSDNTSNAVALGYGAIAHSNSIALGSGSTTTATNQFMIGSGPYPINEIIMVGGSTSCAIDINGTACSSDERLKTHINSLSSTLSHLHNINAVTYNWGHDPDGSQQIGFLAQNLQQYFPELVKEGHNGYLQVNYAGMTPILTKAIQELDLKINILEQQTTSSGGFSLATLKSVIKDILSDVGSGIQNIFAKRVTTDELCVGSTCISESELIEVLDLRNQQISGNTNQQNNNFNEPEDEDVEEVIEEGESGDENPEEILDEGESDDEDLVQETPDEDITDGASVEDDTDQPESEDFETVDENIDE
jgi:hypothetical protein